MKVRKTCLILGKGIKGIGGILSGNDPSFTITKRFQYGYFLIHESNKNVELYGMLPEFCIQEGWKYPHERVFELLMEKGETSVFVESCTGGLCSKLLTEIPGSSDVFWGGWIVYSNKAKMVLGVKDTTLSLYGAVSRQTVIELAELGREQSGADWSVAVSGIAGPAGGSKQKQVGTVWIGVAGKAGTEAYQFLFRGERAAIREKAAAAAFLLLQKKLETR